MLPPSAEIIFLLPITGAILAYVGEAEVPLKDANVIYTGHILTDVQLDA